LDLSQPGSVIPTVAWAVRCLKEAAAGATVGGIVELIEEGRREGERLDFSISMMADGFNGAPVVLMHTNQDRSWEGWTFGPGEASYSGVMFPIKGKSKKILQRLVKAGGRPVLIEDLCLVSNDQYTVEAVTLATQISRLRSLVRDGLKLPQDFDPIPNVDGEAYRLMPIPKV
jgi:hypothetical protein